jgi:serine/threonine protein phosphatase PrpC
MKERRGKAEPVTQLDVPYIETHQCDAGSGDCALYFAIPAYHGYGVIVCDGHATQDELQKHAFRIDCHCARRACELLRQEIIYISENWHAGFCTAKQDTVSKLLEACFSRVHGVLSTEFRTCGTTASVLLFLQNCIVAAWVGNSPFVVLDHRNNVVLDHVPPRQGQPRANIPKSHNDAHGYASSILADSNHHSCENRTSLGDIAFADFGFTSCKPQVRVVDRPATQEEGPLRVCLASDGFNDVSLVEDVPSFLLNSLAKPANIVQHCFDVLCDRSRSHFGHPVDDCTLCILSVEKS